MKVKFKLLIFIVLLAIIPVVIINIFSSSRITDSSIELYTASTKSIIENQADNIDFYFEEIIAASKELASSETVRNYAVNSNAEGISLSDYRSEYAQITEKFEALTSNNSSLRKIMIINNSGMIIASTDSSDTALRSPITAFLHFL